MNHKHFDELADSWQRPSGIFIIAEIGGEVGQWVREIQREYDPKLAGSLPPHLTLVGSSGLGPIPGSTTTQQLKAALAPIAASTPPMTIELQRPVRFLQTDIVVLPMDPYGLIRQLHDRIGASGLSFGPVRYAFTPHITLNFYRTLTASQRRSLLALTAPGPCTIDHLRCSKTNDPLPPQSVIEFTLDGVSREP